MSVYVCTYCSESQLKDKEHSLTYYIKKKVEDF